MAPGLLCRAARAAFVSSPRPSERLICRRSSSIDVQLLQSDAMQVRGIEVQRGPGPHLGPIQPLAVGRRPQPGLLARGFPVGAPQDLEEGLVGRPDGVVGWPRPACRDRPGVGGVAATATGDSSSGMASIRSSWPMTRSVTIRAAVSPLASPSRASSEIGGHVARVVGDPRQEGSKRSGVSVRWKVARSGMIVCGPSIWSTALSRSIRCSCCSSSSPADHPQDVQGDRFLGRQGVPSISARGGPAVRPALGGGLGLDRVCGLERLASAAGGSCRGLPDPGRPDGPRPARSRASWP